MRILDTENGCGMACRYSFEQKDDHCYGYAAVTDDKVFATYNFLLILPFL